VERHHLREHAAHVDGDRRRLGESALEARCDEEVVLIGQKTVERWLQMLENLYLCFRVAPYGAPRIRAVKKERKLYLWDWSAVTDEGARLENLVASQLLKYCHRIEDTEGHRMELRFLRDTDRREVDFVVLQGKRPLFAVECKTGDRQISPAVKYFAERTSIPRFFQVHRGTKHYALGKIIVVPLGRFCLDLDMP
jgi:predicted AAA+ superfamily ATPase